MEYPDDPRRPLLGTTSTKEGDAGAAHPESLSQRPLSSSQPPSYNSASQDIEGEDTGEADMDLQNMSRKSQWIILALASGACAAFNGVFAKL